MITDLLSTDGFIIYNKKLARTIGTNPAILLGYLCSEYNFYSSNGLLDNGMFFCTREKIKYNTGLTETEQRTATKKLKELGIIETELKGMPSKTYYKINENNVSSILSSEETSQQGLRNPYNKTLENLTTRSKESLQHDIRNPHTINNINNNLKQNTKDNIKKNSKKSSSISKLIIETCLKNDVEDDKSIELIEQFLTEMKIKTRGSIEANIAKVAGQKYTTIKKLIDLAYSRNYKYIPEVSWLGDNKSNYSSRLPKELRLNCTTTEEDRQKFKKLMETNDKSLKHF